MPRNDDTLVKIASGSKGGQIVATLHKESVQLKEANQTFQNDADLM